MPAQSDVEDSVAHLLDMLDRTVFYATYMVTQLEAGPDKRAIQQMVETAAELRHLSARVEALTVTILHEAGASWDEMAGHLEVTKQSLHRRLQKYGEEEYQYAIEYGHLFRESDLELLQFALGRRRSTRSADKLRQSCAARLLHRPIP